MYADGVFFDSKRPDEFFNGCRMAGRAFCGFMGVKWLTDETNSLFSETNCAIAPCVVWESQSQPAEAGNGG